VGTDTIQLFNKGIADRILAMDLDMLKRFVEENTPVWLKDSFYGLHSLRAEIDRNGVSVSEAVDTVLTKGWYTFPELKASVAKSFAFGDERISLTFGDDRIWLDYYGCYAEVFEESSSRPTLDLYELLYQLQIDEDGPSVLLLETNHLEQMIQSLHEHIHELRIMDTDDVKRLESWRDFCVANPDYMVAYHFDY
jgi:hypothetical protein